MVFFIILIVFTILFVFFIFKWIFVSPFEEENPSKPFIYIDKSTTIHNHDNRVVNLIESDKHTIDS